MAAPELPHFGPASTDALREVIGEPPRRLTVWDDGTPIGDEPPEDEDDTVVAITDDPGWPGWGNSRGEHIPPTRGGTSRHRAAGDQPDRPLPNYAPALYDEHPVLGRIRDHAHARRVSADAVLLSTLVLVSGAIPGGIIVDSGLKSPTIPCLYGALVADSGGGKTTAANVAQDLLDVRVLLGLSSGEGMIEAFYGDVDTFNAKGDKTGSKRAIVRRNAQFQADEGATLYAEMAREGSKTAATLREFWSGGNLGTANATRDRNRSVPKRTYNGSLLVGLQTDIVGTLIGETGMGTAQRFLWAATHDIHLNRDAPAWDGPLFLPPHVPQDFDGQPVVTSERFTVEQAIYDELDAAETDRVMLRVQVEAQDSHRPVLLLKIGAVLAWMDSRLVITVEDWNTAAHILDQSCQVREALIEAAEQQSRDSVVKAGHQRAAVRAAENGRDRAVAEVKARLFDVLGKSAEPVPAGQLRAGVTRRGGKRDLVPDALDLLIGDGAAVQTATRGGNISYSLSLEGRREWEQSDQG